MRSREEILKCISELDTENDEVDIEIEKYLLWVLEDSCVTSDGGYAVLGDVAETEWIRHARTLSMEDVLECYINEIEEITGDYDSTGRIKKQLVELLKIYLGNVA